MSAMYTTILHTLYNVKVKIASLSLLASLVKCVKYIEDYLSI